MASPKKTIRLSPDLLEICQFRAKQLGYPDESAYIRGLIRYDGMVGGSHGVTLPIAEQSLTSQDRIDAKILDHVRKGISERGEFFRHLLAQMLEDSLTPSGEGIAKKLTEKPKIQPKAQS